MSEQNHRDFIIRQLDEWYNKNQSSINLPNGNFIENVDFKLTIILDQSAEDARMTCSCGVRVQLGKERRNFSLSNFYKHIKSSRCTMIKNKRANVSSKVDNDEEDDFDADNESVQEETSENDSDDFSTSLAGVENTNDHRTHRGPSKKRAASSSWSSSVKKK